MIRTLLLHGFIVSALLASVLAQEPCLDFEDVPIDFDFFEGAEVLEGGVLRKVAEVDGVMVAFGSNPEGDDDEPALSTAGVAGHSGKELFLNWTKFEILTESPGGITFHYSQPRLGTQIWINGEHAFAAGLPDLNGRTIGGATVSMTHESEGDEGSRGTVTITGNVSNFAMAGAIYVDHICGPGSSGSSGKAGPLTILSANRSSPLVRDVRLELKADDTTGLVLYRSRDLGANSEWIEIPEAKFTPTANANIWSIVVGTVASEPVMYFRVGDDSG